LTAVTVITPAYRPRDVSAYAASHAACAGAGVEWIVVDDGSGPGFDDAFGRIASLGARVIRREANAGQGAARNLGLLGASGRWVKFLDIDDRLPAGHLDALLDAAGTLPPRTIPFAPTVHVWPSGARMRNDSWLDLGRTPQEQFTRLLTAPFLSHCGALFPRDLLLELGGYDEDLATDEDGDLLFRVLFEGYSFAAVPEAEYLYIHHEGARVSVDDDPRKIASRERVCDKLETLITARQMPQTARTALAQRIDRIAMAAWERDRATGARLLQKARRICPDYPLPGRLPLRLARRIGGPALARRASALAQRLRGRLPGGMRA
jgi:glycosyltransferase involved in cell wall biosynthesis